MSERRSQAEVRTAFAPFVPFSTRWMDHVVYGRLNNVVCNFFRALALAQRVEAGTRIGQVSRRGGASICDQVGLFAEGAELCAARGHSIPVCGGRQTRRPVSALSPEFVSALEGLTS